jgi:hypothetical protein
VAQPFEQPGVIAYSALLAESFGRLLGRPLISGKGDIAKALYHAPFVLVSHDARPDPVFRYANLAAQGVFGYGWEEFVTLPSRLSAEPVLREERQALLDRAARDGYVDDYRGIRIAKSGRRFLIRECILWNVADARGVRHGQAAMFAHWDNL